MTSDRFARVKELTLKAAELSEGEREAFLDEVCAGDDELRREIESFLVHSEDQPGILNTGEKTPIQFSEIARQVDMTGRELSHFRIEKKISAGGMGVLYRAVDLDLHRRVAIKVLKPDLLSHPGGRELFVREARAASALNHPGIVTVHEIGFDSGIDFIAMEYVEGSSLDRMIPPSGLPLKIAVRYSLAMAEALKVAHHHGIIHRDLKPANIMITSDNNPKILDFGIAMRLKPNPLAADTEHAANPEEQKGAILGTIGYMSPEQVEGKSVDHRSDLFSLGIVMYELIAGSAPFRRDSREETLEAIIRDDPGPLEEVRPDIPGILREIVTRLLAREREERYQSADELTRDLKRFVRSREVDRARTTVAPGEKSAVTSLAILYIRNLGAEEEEFLSYGITEDLIIDLSRIGTLRVAPMRSILKHKDSGASLKEIARELNVSMLLEGSIHKSPDTIRVSAQLVDVGRDETIWGKSWEEAHDSLPLVKQDLARGISNALGVAATAQKMAQVGRMEAENPKAYEYYLQGKYAFEHKRDAADVDVAQEFFRNALALEGSFPAARVGIARICLHKSDFEETDRHLRIALEDARKLESPVDEANILRLLAEVGHKKSRWDEAWEHGEKALRIYVVMGDLEGEAGVLGSLISILSKQSKFARAIDLYERVYEINCGLDDPKKIAVTLRNMGFMRYRMGENDLALEPTRKALEIARKHDDISMEADCIANIGLYSENRDRLETLRCYEQALRIYAQLGKTGNRALMLNNIAGILVINGDYMKALELLEAASEIYNELGERANCAFVRLNVAETLNASGEYEGAVDAANEALALAAELDYPVLFTGAQEQLGTAALYRGEYQSAREFYTAGLEVAESAGHRREYGWFNALLGEICYMRDEPDLSREHLQKAVVVAEDIDERETLLKSGAYLAALMVRDGDFEKGIARFREVEKNCEDHGDPRFILITSRLLGQSLIRHGRDESEREEGRALLAEALSLAQERGIAHEIRWIGLPLS